MWSHHLALWMLFLCRWRLSISSVIQVLHFTQGLTWALPDMSKPTFPKDLRILFTVYVCVYVCKMLFLQGFHRGSVSQLCPTLWDPVDFRPPGSSVHGILQARILEWIAIPFSRGSSRPRDGTGVSHIAGRFFISWATREALKKEKSYEAMKRCKGTWNACY